jgi:hypothetical protein
MFFESVLDRLVEEVYHRELFDFQNVSLLNHMDSLKDLKGLNEEQRQAQIDKAYKAITKEKEGLISELSAATGVTGSLYYEKN